MNSSLNMQEQAGGMYSAGLDSKDPKYMCVLCLMHLKG
jgi:hypothetical protein